METVIIAFTQPHALYFSGDVAGFPKATAGKYVAMGVANYVNESDAPVVEEVVNEAGVVEEQPSEKQNKKNNKG